MELEAHPVPPRRQGHRAHRVVGRVDTAQQQQDALIPGAVSAALYWAERAATADRLEVAELLYTPEALREVREGTLHTGQAAVVQLVGYQALLVVT